MIENGKIVKIHYTGTLNDGTQFDSSKGREPLTFEIGGGMVIAGFDAAVKTMEIGEVKTVTIPANEAYGEVNPQMIMEFPKSNIPEDMPVEIGMQLMMQTPEGHPVPVKIVAINEESITLDANHELAGKDLTFELELVEIA